MVWLVSKWKERMQGEEDISSEMENRQRELAEIRENIRREREEIRSSEMDENRRRELDEIRQEMEERNSSDSYGGDCCWILCMCVTIAPAIVPAAIILHLVFVRVVAICGWVVALIWKLVGRRYGRSSPDERARSEPVYEEGSTVPEPVAVYDLNSWLVYSRMDVESHGVSREPAGDSGDICCLCLGELSAHTAGAADVVWTQCCRQKLHADCVRLWASRGQSPPGCPYCLIRSLRLNPSS